MNRNSSKQVFETSYPGDVPSHIVERRVDARTKLKRRQRAAMVLAPIVAAGTVGAFVKGNEALDRHWGIDDKSLQEKTQQQDTMFNTGVDEQGNVIRIYPMSESK